MPSFTLLVTGSRDATKEYHAFEIRQMIERLAMKFNPKEWAWHLIHGAANGVDICCAMYVIFHEYCKPKNVHKFEPDWSLGKWAGNRRNQLMVDLAVMQHYNGHRVGCLAFPAIQDLEHQKLTGRTRGGTLDCIERAKSAGIGVLSHPLDVAAARAERLARKEAL